MLDTYAVGHDFGNSDCKTVMMDRQGKKLSLVIPSEVAPGELQRLKSLDIKLKSNSYVFRNEDISLYVGDLAIHQARNSYSGRGDYTRYYSDTALYTLLTTTSALTPDKQEISIIVCTGVPVDTFINNPTIKKEIKKKLSGTHEFYLNDVKRVTHIQTKAIAIEGAGAITHYGMNGRVRLACIDVGGKTSDCYVAFNQEPIESLCFSISLGTEDINEQLNNQFQTLYGRPLDRTELRDILYASTNNHKPNAIYADGIQVTNIQQLAWKATYKVGNDIASHVASKWKDNLAGKVGGSFARVILVGGGATLSNFRDAIRRKIPNIVIPDYPQMANVEGYCDIAKVYVQREG